MKQPQALRPLFLTEMWERFGFYVTQSLLILYLTNFLNFSDPKSYLILGEYTALIYIAPLAGGFFADRILGPRFSIVIGAVFLGAGYLLLSLIGQHLLYFCLAVIVIGNGLLKPNISSFLGEFYYQDDPRRDAGFTLFYMGINLGGLLALGSAGFLQEKLGWSTAFITAAFGMAFALGTFCYAFKSFENRGLPIPRDQIKPKSLQWMRHKISITALLVVSLIIAFLLLRSAQIAEILQSIFGIVILLVMIYIALRSEPRQRNKLLALLILIVTSIIFWGLLFQAFASVNLFTERNVDRHIFGLEMPPPVFIALEPIFIVLLGPFLASLWQRLHIKKMDPTPGIKFSLAMFSAAIAMGILMLSIIWHRPEELISPVWILFFYLFLTLGEMLLSPIGLSMVTELSPLHLTGLMMGVWFMALGFGGELSGFLATQASIPKNLVSLAQSDAIYLHAFRNNAILALIVGVILLVISPWLKRLVKS